MRQTIHIFAKDARHWRWPVVMLMVLLAVRTVLLPRYTPIYSRGWELNRTIDLLEMLLPVVWWFLSALVIHDESLVGDRQFWVTRPYSWRSLLAAKALFLAVFVLAPVLVSDAVILAADGFSPWVLLPRLLVFELLKVAILTFAAVLASITSGMRQFLLGCMLLVVFAQADQFLGTPGGFPAMWVRALYLAVPSALLIWQYAQRRTQVVRCLAAPVFVLLAVPAVWPDSKIPVAGKAPQPDIEIRFDSSRQRLADGPWWPEVMRDRVEVNLPIELTGRERDLLNGALVDLRVNDRGQIWHPRRDWRTNLTRREDRDWLEIAFREEDYQRLKNDAVTALAEFAIWVYERQSDITLRRNGDWQRIEGVGFARIQSDMGGVWVERRTPFHDQEQKLLYSMPLLWFGGVIRGESSGIYPPSPLEWHLTPVVTSATPLSAPEMGTRSVRMKMSPWQEPPRPPDVNVQVLRPVALLKRTLTIEGVRLADWVVKPR